MMALTTTKSDIGTENGGRERENEKSILFLPFSS